MFKTLLKILFKCVLVIGAVYVATKVITALNKGRNDYIEIYNDEGLEAELY